ncbi:MAG: hypothetical protein U0790_29010 [Isosphaeraceae bacterium]
MELRSWTATLAFAAGLLLVPHARATSQGPAQNPEAPKVAAKAEAPEASRDPQPDAPAGQSVKLNVMIAGLGRDGCDVEVKPGNRSCRFKPQVKHVGSRGELSFQFKDIEVLGVDRNCSFAITVREAGRDPKTIYRGFRLPARAAGTPAASQTYTCYMNSPSKLADLQRTDRIRQ